MRTRLAVLHAAVVFACGVLVLAFVDIPLVAASHTVPAPGQPAGGAVETTGNLAEVLGYSAVALVVIAVLSVPAGWLIAGRALRPLHVITAAARTMSADDLTGRLRVPAAYREFTELADTLDGLLHRLDESFTAQRQFVANASHELRTPLTVQKTLLQVSLADPGATAGTLRSACTELLALGEQQEHLIAALLTLAGGYQPIERRERFDLADLTRRVVLDHPRPDISVHTALTPTMVTGDPRLAASLVSNLVDNALRHNNPGGGTVEIATTPPGRLTVSNTGPEIPPADIERIFQPFQRLGTDRTDQTGGHGLGLAIVAAIAHAHDATLTAQPRPGGGLQVTVDMPPADPLPVESPPAGAPQ